MNTLIHREFTSAHYAKFVIEKDRMFTENANRAVTGNVITPDNFEPNPKNPVIAAFFRNIGLADELGSGVRRLHHYVPRYSGKSPEMIDSDIFRVIVPLDDEYSFGTDINKAQNLNHKNCGLNCGLTEKAILDYIKLNPTASQKDTAYAIEKSLRTVETAFASLKEKGLLKREGARKNGKWIVIE